MIVVSDTSPILSLACIDRLDLLKALYGQLLIPSAVFAELNAGSDLPKPIAFDRLPWISVANPRDSHRVRDLQQDLDLGEAEAIALAIERQADLLLIDERRGRLTARASGVVVVGLLGVILDAKKTGIIESGRPIVDALIDVGKFWVGPALYACIVAQFGEG